MVSIIYKKQVMSAIHALVNKIKLKASQSLLERRHQGTPVSSSSVQILTVGLKERFSF